MVQDALMENDGVSETLDEMEEISRNEKKFEKRRLRPLASFLDFDVSHRPTQAQDRISKKRVYFGIFLGILLIALGLISNVSSEADPLFAKSQKVTLSDNIFSASWLFVGLGIFRE